MSSSKHHFTALPVLCSLQVVKQTLSFFLDDLYNREHISANNAIQVADKPAWRYFPFGSCFPVFPVPKIRRSSM